MSNGRILFLPRRRRDGAYYVSVGDLRRWLRALPASAEVRVAMDTDTDPETAYRVEIGSDGTKAMGTVVCITSGFASHEARDR